MWTVPWLMWNVDYIVPWHMWTILYHGLCGLYCTMANVDYIVPWHMWTIKYHGLCGLCVMWIILHHEICRLYVLLIKLYQSQNQTLPNPILYLNFFFIIMKYQFNYFYMKRKRMQNIVNDLYVSMKIKEKTIPKFKKNNFLHGTISYI